MKLTLALFLCLLGLACLPKNKFVLLPDRDGKVGSVTVTNPKGRSTLDQASQCVEVAGPGSAPRAPKLISAQEIQSAFGAALAAEPQPTRTFFLYFPAGSSELDPMAVAELDQVLKEIRQRDSRDISINGHCDTTGDPETNMQISLARAEKVRSLLVQSGVKAEYLSVAYHGKGNLLVPTSDNVPEPRNRRVEVIVR